MDDAPIISVRGVGKAYRIWETPSGRLLAPLIAQLAKLLPRGLRIRALLERQAATQFRDFWALQDVSFEVRRGESVGIVGRNGSGKSTLLQIIAGTLQPTTGSVTVRGRVAALLELGSGFNPEFTGRENVYLNGAVLGLPKAEIDARFAQIAAFADIGEFIEQPVKTYSSGMLVRLAFAVAINVSADIIIVDEALAVGDMNFQAKCVSALRRLQEAGAAFLIVTHGTDVVKSMCARAVYLKKGSVVAHGIASEIADAYFREMREELSAEIARSCLPNTLPTKKAGELTGEANDTNRPRFSDNPDFARRVASMRSGTGEARITDVQLLDTDGLPVTRVRFDQAVRIRLHIRLLEAMAFHAGYHVRDEHNLSLLSTGTYTETRTVMHAAAGDQVIVEFSLRLPLRHGRYSVLALVSTNYIVNQTAQFVDWVETAVVFEMLPREPQVLWAPVYLKNELRVWQSQS
jgi:lipopolysaccharide transport system ATP-binding protein